MACPYNGPPGLPSDFRGPHRLLGQILTDGGYVTLTQLNDARRRQMLETERRIGEILVEMGHLAPEALARALAIQSSEENRG